MYVNISTTVGRSILLRKTYEPLTESWIRRLLSQGHAFIDVGAHSGYFSIIASDIVGKTGEIHAFEPQPDMSRLLRGGYEQTQCGIST